MPKELARMVKGQPPSLIEAAEANKIIDAVNTLMRGFTVNPSSYGSFKMSDDKGTLDLSPLTDAINQIVQKAVSDALNGSPDPNNDGTSKSGGGPSLPTIQQQIDNILNGLRSASISLSCNDDGTITGTITIPV